VQEGGVKKTNRVLFGGSLLSLKLLQISELDFPSPKSGPVLLHMFLGGGKWPGRQKRKENKK